MAIVIKRVILSVDTSRRESGLILAFNKGEYHINYFHYLDIETLEKGIKDKEEAKKKFLDFVWELS